MLNPRRDTASFTTSPETRYGVVNRRVVLLLVLSWSSSAFDTRTIFSFTFDVLLWF